MSQTERRPLAEVEATFWALVNSAEPSDQDAAAARHAAIRAAHAELTQAQAAARRDAKRAALDATGLSVGMTVKEAKGERTGIVEALVVAERPYQKQPPGTVFAKVRYCGTWQRFNGRSGDSVVTKRAALFVAA